MLLSGSLAGAVGGAGAAKPGETNLTGFTASGGAQERAWEKRFDAQINPAEQREWLERMAAEPNQVGSAHDRTNAEFMLEKFREWGWEAEIETFYVLYPTPRTELLELVAPGQFKAQLSEPPVAGDQTSGRTQDALPPYNVYGGDGDVTAELVVRKLRHARRLQGAGPAQNQCKG